MSKEGHSDVEVVATLPTPNDEIPPENSTSEPSENAKTALLSIWHHTVPCKAVLARLGTNGQLGLSPKEAEHRLQKFGRNVITPPPETPWFLQLLSHFTDFFSLLLQFAAILCFVAYASERNNQLHLYLGVFLYLVVIATSLFTFMQQRKSDETLREFRNFLPPKAMVRRDSEHPSRIDASMLVVGDIIHLKLGDKIPADVRILQSHRFTVDNSSLTGESEPFELGETPTHETCSPLEANNLAFFGCQGVDGSATAVVIATGDRTVFGDIAALTLAAASEHSLTTLQLDIHHFVLRISAFALAVGVFFFIVGVSMGARLLHNLVYSIGIIVSNIPEGLLATVTVSLTASARRMAVKNVLVKQLDAIESLGSTSVICTDKTGTLTQNKMSISHISYGGRIEHVTSKWSPPISEEGVDTGAQHCFCALLHGASICSTAEFDEEDMTRHPGRMVGDRVVNGDASEAGILRFTESIHNVASYRWERPLLSMIPFNSRNKYMVTVNREEEPSSLVRVVMKGAPEKVIEKCTTILGSNGERPLSQEDEQLIEKQMQYLAGRGERVLGYAEVFLSPENSSSIINRNGTEQLSEDILTSNLCFLGLISLIDPPRDGVANAVRSCKSAGIRVVMITGDHPETARSVAQNVGIVTQTVYGDGDSRVTIENDAIVVTGNDIVNISDERWDTILSHSEIVFARTSPQQKLEIVTHLQRHGEVVTVTGDGCNDAPALKRAHTGIAMGISGSEVSREAANIVILDDNFASIVNGVEEGRLVFDNLKKSIAYTLTSNVPQLVPFLVFITLQIPLPLTTVLILCIDLGTDVFPAIALAYEQPETDIMRRPPRDPQVEHLVNSRLVSYSNAQLGIMQTFGGFLAYFVVFADYGLAPQAMVRLNNGGHFAAVQPSAQRWMYSVHPRVRGRGFEANWFSKSNPYFKVYFDQAKKGFIRQTAEQFDSLPTRKPKTFPPTTGGVVPTVEQFQNMVKIIAVVTNRPPCLEFTCSLKGQKVATRNDMLCFNVGLNTGPVFLTGIRNGRRNDNVTTGNGPKQGCFSLWTPRYERIVLRHAQTAFFASIVVAQLFTLFACKTRILSVFERQLSNSAILLALLLEILVIALIVNHPILRRGFGVQSLRIEHWLLGIPFGVFILLYDECRKWFVRRHIENESGYIVPRRKPIDRIARWVHSFTLW